MLTHGAQDANHFRGDAHRDFNNRLIRRLAGLLREVASDRIFVALDLAFVRAVFVEDHSEKGGLAGAVRADEGDALAPVDRHFRLAEKAAAAERFGELMNREHAAGLEQECAWGKDFGRKLKFVK